MSTATVILPVASLASDLRRAVFRPLLPARWPAGFVQFSLRTLVAGLVATLVFSRSEVLVLDAYGLVSQAGVYALAVGLAGQITAPIDAMLGPLIPAAASLVASRRDRAAEAVQRGIRLSGAATLPVLVVAVPALALLVPLIYGSRFDDVGLMFVALGVVSCVQSALHPVTAFVGAVRRPLTVLAFNGLALVADLGLVIALGPAFGAPAAVVANCAGQLVSLALSVWLVRRELGVSARSVLGALRPLGLVAVCTVGGVAVAMRLDIGALEGAGVASTMAAASSWLVLRWSGGALLASDLAAVTEALPARLRPVLAATKRLRVVR